MRRHNNLDYFYIYKGFIRHQNLLIIKIYCKEKLELLAQMVDAFFGFSIQFPLWRAKAISCDLKNCQSLPWQHFLFSSHSARFRCCSFESNLWGLFLSSAPLNSLLPNISMHIPHTIFFIFPKVLKRRICLRIKSSFSLWSFPLFSLP